jgi:hypothetical protein
MQMTAPYCSNLQVTGAVWIAWSPSGPIAQNAIPWAPAHSYMRDAELLTDEARVAFLGPDSSNCLAVLRGCLTIPSQDPEAPSGICAGLIS